MSSVFLVVYNHDIVIIIKYPNPMTTPCYNLQLTNEMCYLPKKCLHFLKCHSDKRVWICGILFTFVRTREVGVSSRNIVSLTFPHFSQSMLTPMLCILQTALWANIQSACTRGIIYYIKLQKSVSVCLYPPFFFDTTVGPQPNLAHMFG